MNLPIGSSFGQKGLVGRGGVEPPTSRLSGVRSNHLSYRPQSTGRSWPQGCGWSLSPRRGTTPEDSAGGTGEAGGAYRDRTGDLMLAKHALSQLS
jgi:hypothetical protein